MFDLSKLAKILEQSLNDKGQVNKIKFAIGTDRDVYLGRLKTQGNFTIHGVLTALPGSYEPLKGIKVAYMPISIELYAYAGLHDEPFTLEQQKNCITQVVEEFNGNTIEQDGEFIVFEGATVTVGNVTTSASNSYDRIPILMQFSITVVQQAELANKIDVQIDGEIAVATEFTVHMERQSESMTFVGQNKAQTVCSSAMRTFGGVFYMTSEAYLRALEQDLLDDANINNVHTLVYKGRTYNVVTKVASELLKMGGIVMLQVTFMEALKAV